MQNLLSCSLLCYAAVNGFVQTKYQPRSQFSISMVADFSPGDADILVRAFRGENVERTPVWLMRQVQDVTSKDGATIPPRKLHHY